MFKMLLRGSSCAEVAPAPWCASQRSLPLRCRQLVCATPYHAPPVVAPTTEQVARHHHVQGRLPGALGMVYGAQAAPQLQCREDAAVGGACSSAVGAAQPAGGADLQSWSGVEYQAWTVLDTAEFVGQVLTICTSFALLLVGVLKAAVDGARRALLEEPVLHLQKVLAYVQQRLHSDLPPSIPDAVGHYEEVQVQFDVAAVELLRPLARAARALRLQLLRLQWRAWRMVCAAAAM